MNYTQHPTTWQQRRNLARKLAERRVRAHKIHKAKELLKTVAGAMLGVSIAWILSIVILSI